MSISKTSIICISISFFFTTSCGSLNNGKLKYQKSNTSSSKEHIKVNDEAIPVNNNSTEELYASQNTNHTITPPKPHQKMLIKLSPDDSLKVSKCDTILMKDGTKIAAKVIEIGPDAIKYKRCDNLAGPLYIKHPSDATSITYSNGTTEIVKSQVPKSAVIVQKAPRKPKTAIGGLVLGIIGLSLGIAFTILSGGLLFIIAASLGFLAINFAISSEVILKKNIDSKLGRTLGVVSLILGGLSMISLTVLFLTLFIF